MEQSKWIAHARIDQENKINFLCFTYPGGSASNFATWKRKIDPSINLIPILYPEREIRKNDMMEETFALFIKDFVEENEALFKIPYAFFGYCGGAVLAYEASIKVRELYGREPVWGMIASSEAPEYLRDSLVAFPNKDAKKDIIEYLLGLGMFDESVLKSNMFLDYYIPLLKADCKMLDTYVHQEHKKLKCDFDILFGEDDTTVKYEKAQKWRDVTNGEARVQMCKGGHFFVDQQKDFVCSLINERLLREA